MYKIFVKKNYPAGTEFSKIPIFISEESSVDGYDPYLTAYKEHEEYQRLKILKSESIYHKAISLKNYLEETKCYPSKYYLMVLRVNIETENGEDEFDIIEHNILFDSYESAVAEAMNQEKKDICVRALVLVDSILETGEEERIIANDKMVIWDSGRRFFYNNEGKRRVFTSVNSISKLTPSSLK